MHFIRIMLPLALLPYLAVASDGGAQEEDAKMIASVEQLRYSIGLWSVTTEFLNEDGTVSRSMEGTYEFEWVVPDKVIMGKSELPALGRSSALLFYVNEKKKTIEMVSVGADGYLWIMSGPLGEETRYTQEFESQNGKNSQLRFTRFNVERDTFESRMEFTEDGGETWKPGNHQVFRRQTSEEAGS